MRSGFFIACCSLLLLCGCIISQVQYHGYPASDKKLWDSVKVGSKLSEVLDILGPPVLEEKSSAGGRALLYPSCAVYTALSSVIRNYSCETLRLTLDDAEHVSSVERLTVKKQRHQKPSGPHTITTGIHDSAWRKVGNLFKRRV